MTRRRRRTGSTRLTEAQLEELCSVMAYICHVTREGGPAFESDEARRTAWFKHKDDVRRHYQRVYLRPEYGQQKPEPLAYYCYENVPPDERESYP